MDNILKLRIFLLLLFAELALEGIKASKRLPFDLLGRGGIVIMGTTVLIIHRLLGE